MASYPFFLAVAAATGRLLTLQGTAGRSQILRRVAETWGQRSSVKRSGERVIRSMVQWRALEDTRARGVYCCPRRRPVRDGVGASFAEALLIGGSSQTLPLRDLASHPALFPFEARLSARTLGRSPRVAVHRQGMDDDVVELATGG